MKTLACALIILTVTNFASAQSHTFQKFRDKFGYADEVHAFKVNGFLVRTVLSFAGEHEAKRAFRHISQVRLVTVPKSAFERKTVTVAGFKKVVKADEYEELLNVREDGQDVTFYQTSQSHRENRYLVLVDDEQDVVLIEITGDVDTDYLKSLYIKEQKS